MFLDSPFSLCLQRNANEAEGDPVCKKERVQLRKQIFQTQSPLLLRCFPSGVLPDLAFSSSRLVVTCILQDTDVQIVHEMPSSSHLA